MTFSASQTQCSEDAFVHQDTSAEPHRSCHSPEMGQHKGAASPVSNALLNGSTNERPLVQGAHRNGWKGWGGAFTVTNILMEKQD